MMTPRSLGPLALTLLILHAACRPAPAPTTDPNARERASRINNQGHARLERFEYAQAAEAFRQALAADATFATARLNLSLALLYEQDLAGARREAAEAARLLPDAPQPHYVLGLIARAENRVDEAVAEFSKVHAIDADDVGTRVNLAQIALEQQRYAEAATMLRPAVAAEPYNVSAAYNLGLALTRAGDADGGTVLTAAQALRSTGYATTYGTGYLEQGRYAEAIVATGREPGLVDQAVPTTTFTATALAAAGPARPSPFGRRFQASALTPAGVRELAASLGGCVAPLDWNDDGALDLFVASAEGQRLFQNDGRRALKEVSADVGLTAVLADTPPVACVSADYDNDGRADLLVVRHGGLSLYHHDGTRYRDVARTAGLSAYRYLPGAAAMSDLDHDGDLDIVIGGLADLDATRRQPASGEGWAFPYDFVPPPLMAWRNNGNGTFTDTTRSLGGPVAAHTVAIVPTDFDNRRDVDLLIVGTEWPPRLLQNQRDGSFKDVASAVGLAALSGAPRRLSAVTAGDVNKDDAPDFLFSGPDGSVLALSDGRGRLSASPLPDARRELVAAQLSDYDNDGLLDIVSWSGNRLTVWRATGDAWADVSATAAAAAGPVPASARAVAIADLDADLAPDVFVAAPEPAVWWSSGTAGRQALRVDLRGRNSNRPGVGAKIEVRAGALRGRVETSAASPMVGPAGVIFGFGRRPGADAVRVLWPSGTLQAELAAGANANGDVLRSPLLIEELDRKPSSCPFLFVWNGERFEFVTDFMGGGEMGYWEAPGVRNVPDPLEYVRIPAGLLRPRNGRLELRVTNELEETLFADRLALMSVAHPADVEVYPDEGMSTPPKPFRLLPVSGARVPRATDEHGHDVTDRIALLDRRYPDDFAVEKIRGYARPHHLALDLAPVPPRPVLLLTAWTDYAFSSDNVAATHSRLALTLPALEIRGVDGRWRPAVPDIGIPVGRPQTVTVDLGPLLRPGEHEVRVATNMKIFWDHVRVGTLEAAAVTTETLDAEYAALSERGFSAEVRPDGQDPPGYDYDRVSTLSPWKALPGRYTRAGDVRPLLHEADDMFVIAKPGDQMALSFVAPTAPLPAGWTRTFLLVADGYSKEMDINSSSPDRVGPLPFHRMTRYPYGPDETYPDTDAHRRYLETYNTRIVARDLAPLEAR